MPFGVLKIEVQTCLSALLKHDKRLAAVAFDERPSFFDSSTDSRVIHEIRRHLLLPSSSFYDACKLSTYLIMK